MPLRSPLRLAPRACAALIFGFAGSMAHAQESRAPGWLAGDWSLTLGASTSFAPRYQGADKLAFFAQPMISLGRTGKGPRFTSRNDNIALALYENEIFRVGPVGKILFERDDKDRDLRGLGKVPWGGEVGAFFDLYPAHWFRLRTEIRQGFRAHGGLVVDMAGDAFHDLTPSLRISGGPRLSLATADYFRAYYGVNATQSAASGLAPYRPDGGVRAIGVGGALTWKATDKITTSLFSEYARLVGPAASSTLVRQRGSVNQFTIGVSATYRFDFTM